MFEQAPKRAPDPAQALAKVLEAQRRKAEREAEKKAHAQRVTEEARLSLEETTRGQAALPLGQPSAGVSSAWGASALSDTPSDTPSDSTAAGLPRPMQGAPRPSRPRAISEGLSDGFEDD